MLKGQQKMVTKKWIYINLHKNWKRSGRLAKRFTETDTTNKNINLQMLGLISECTKPHCERKREWSMPLEINFLCVFPVIWIKVGYNNQRSAHYLFKIRRDGLEQSLWNVVAQLIGSPFLIQMYISHF